MSITESLGIDHIMATPGRTRVILGLPPALPEKKKRGPKPGSKHKKKAAVSLDGQIKNAPKHWWEVWKWW